MKVAALLTCFLLSAACLYCQDKDSMKVVKVDTGKGNFTMIEIEAGFKGGAQAWNAFLSKNFVYPKKAIKKRIEGTVIISFVVDTQGHVTDINVLQDPGGGLGDEGVRIIKMSDGMWSPAFQNGRKVKALKRQPIVFKLI